MMDPDSPVSRVERTLWTVWCYITEAVNRLLRPQPASSISDPNSCQDSAVQSEPPDCGLAEDVTTSGERIAEEESLATASLLSSSQPVVAWELCTTDVDSGPDEESMQYKTQLSRSSECKESEDGEGTTEEQLDQMEHSDAALLTSKEAKQEKQEKTESDKFHTSGQHETPENDVQEQHVNTGSQILTDDDTVNEKMEKSEGKDGAEETVSAMPLDDHQKTDKSIIKIQVNEEDDQIHHEDEQNSEAEETGVKVCTITDLGPEEKHSSDKGDEEGQQEDEVTMVTPEEAKNYEGVSQVAPDNETKLDEGTKGENQLTAHVEFSDEVIAVEEEHAVAHRSESDEDEEEDKSSLDEREQGTVSEEENINEAATNQTIDEVLEHKIDVTEDGQEENILSQRVECIEEPVQSAETWLYTAEFTDKEPQHVTILQTNTIDPDVMITDVAKDQTGADKDQVEEEKFCSQVDNKESFVEIIYTTTSGMVKPEGETGREISKELESIPVGITEGQVVVLQELNTPACEETQEGVPENNNELGPDENTIPRFLEGGDYEEFQPVQLPEEVESKAQESLQNTEADYLLVREPVEEKQESTEDTEDIVDLLEVEHTGILPLADTGLPQEKEEQHFEAGIQDLGFTFEEEEGELPESSMKTEIGCLRKESVAQVGLKDETENTPEELHDGTEEQLVNFGADEVLSNSKEGGAAGDGCVTEGALTAVEVIGRLEVADFADETLKFLEAEVEKMTDTTFFQESAHPEQNSKTASSLLGDITESGFLQDSVEIEPTLLDDSTVEKQDMGIDMEGKGDREGEGVTEAEMHNKSENELAGMAAELITERKEKETTMIVESELTTRAETKNQSPLRGLEIREEEMITDTEAADDSKTESTPEGLSVMSTEDTTKPVTESEGSYTKEMSSSISEHQDVIDEKILDLWIEEAMSLSAQQRNSQDVFIEETSEAVESHLLEESVSYLDSEITSPEMRHLNQESDRSQEERVESPQTDTESQTELKTELTDSAAKDTEEADDMPLTKMSAFLQDETTKLIDEHLQVILSASSDEIEHTESGQSISGSEASLEEGIVRTKPSSQGDTWTDSQKSSLDGPQPGWSEDIKESLLNRSEEADEPMTKLEDQIEVDAPVLDFSLQRSRIAVKNPRVRPPKDPRSLLHMPSAEPTPTLPVPGKGPVGVPLGGLGIGIKLPGFGAGFPVLKKTQRVVKDENSQENLLQKLETKPEEKSDEKSDAPIQDEAPHKPKWMPPRHPGFGNPLMSELKTKLKKTTE